MTHPIPFRKVETEHIYSLILAGESASLVGTGSVGKSNLLRLLAQDETRQVMLGENWLNTIFVYLDRNKLLDLSMWGLIELILHQILQELANHNPDPQILQAVEDLYRQAVGPADRLLAPRWLDRTVGLICGKSGGCLVFLFDEFDELCAKLPAQTFAILRALRDDYKYKVSYITATRLELSRLRENTAEIEAFEELVTPNTIWLGAYCEEDARAMLKRLAARSQITLEKEDENRLIKSSGGHPGLLRAAFQSLREKPDISEKALAEEPRVQEECRRMWNSFSGDEQKALTGIVINASDTGSAKVLRQLVVKGILEEKSGGRYAIFSPLFNLYIQEGKPVIGARITLDNASLFLDGVLLANLTSQENKLMKFFIENCQRICSRDDIIQKLYGVSGKDLQGNDNRIDAIISRLREKIEPDPKNPVFILTARGHGYKFMDGEPVEETPA